MLNIRDKNKIFFTSDTHFNHNPNWEIPLWKMRGFTSVTEHNDAIFKSINDTVKEDDYLFHLGDFCLNTPPDKFDALIERINCQNVYMLFGNHPNSHFKNVYKPMVKSILKENYTDESEIYPLRYKNIIYIGNYYEAVLGGRFIVMSHYPLMIWNEVKNGAVCLVGHSHGACEYTNSKGEYGKILDVSYDEFKHPLSLQEVIDIVSNKKYRPIDHHL